jgi:hypothetical protein
MLQALRFLEVFVSSDNILLETLGSLGVDQAGTLLSIWDNPVEHHRFRTMEREKRRERGDRSH